MPRFCMWENERYEQRKIFIITDILSLKKDERTEKKENYLAEKLLLTIFTIMQSHFIEEMLIS